MGFSVLITLAVLMLTKVKLPRFIWRGTWVGLLGGMLFCWLSVFPGRV